MLQIPLENIIRKRKWQTIALTVIEEKASKACGRLQEPMGAPGCIRSSELHLQGALMLFMLLLTTIVD